MSKSYSQVGKTKGDEAAKRFKEQAKRSQERPRLPVDPPPEGNRNPLFKGSKDYDCVVGEAVAFVNDKDERCFRLVMVTDEDSKPAGFQIPFFANFDTEDTSDRTVISNTSTIGAVAACLSYMDEDDRPFEPRELGSDDGPGPEDFEKIAADLKEHLDGTLIKVRARNTESKKDGLVYQNYTVLRKPRGQDKEEPVEDEEDETEKEETEEEAPEYPVKGQTVRTRRGVEPKVKEGRVVKIKEDEGEVVVEYKPNGKTPTKVAFEVGNLEWD